MKLQNSTDFPDDLIREVWQFVKPQGVACDVRVRNKSYGTYSGHSYQDRVVASIEPRDLAKDLRERRLIARQGFRASPRPNGSGYLDFALLSPTEALVAVLAHEARHQWQGNARRMKRVDRSHIVYDRPGEIVTTARGIHYNARRIKIPEFRRIPRRGMVWGSRGCFSERDADAYALRKLRAWRRSHRSHLTVNPDLWEIDWRFQRIEIEILTERGYQQVPLIKDNLTGRIEKVAA